MSARRPWLTGWIAAALLPRDDAERLLADLDDEYERFQRARGRGRAATWYWRQVLHSAVILRRHNQRSEDRRMPRTVFPKADPGVRPRGRLELMDALLRDVRYATRRRIAAPAFTVTSVLTLGLAIGATASIFSVVNAVLLTALPYAEPERIIRAWAHQNDGDIEDFSFRVVEYGELTTRTEVFEAVGGEFPVSFTATVPGQEPRQKVFRLELEAVGHAVSPITDLASSVTSLFGQSGSLLRSVYALLKVGS